MLPVEDKQALSNLRYEHAMEFLRSASFPAGPRRGFPFPSSDPGGG